MMIRFTEANQDHSGWPERRVIKGWVLQMIRLTGGTRQEFCNLVDCSLGWLNTITNPKSETTPKLIKLEAIAVAMHDTLPPEVVRAAERLLVTKVRRHPDGNKPKFPDLSPLADCETAAAEARELIRRSFGKTIMELRSRNVTIMERRFGINGYPSMTLEAAAEPYGLTRERVRQIETKLVKVGRLIANAVQTPHLDKIMAELRSNPGRTVASLKEQLQPLLGAMSLETVPTFMALLKGKSDTPTLSTAILATGNRVLIAGNEEDARVARDISIIAKRHQSFAGAVSVDNVRRALEAQLGRLVSIEWLNSLIESMAHVKWLDDGKRWFWMNTGEPSPLLTQVAVIMALAGRPVPIDVIYSGVMKESRRDRLSRAADVASTLAPYEVVFALIQRYHLFRRSSASTFELAEPFDPWTQLDGARRCIAKLLLERGGVASGRELIELTTKAEACSRASIVVGMYLISWIDRLAPGVYKIRGMNVDRKRLDEAIDNAAIVDRRQLVNGMWSMTLVATDYFLRQGMLFTKRSEVPPGVAGLYTLPDGHQFALVDDKHGIRVNRVGTLLRKLLSAPGRQIRLNMDARTMTATPVELEDNVTLNEEEDEVSLDEEVE